MSDQQIHPVSDVHSALLDIAAKAARQVAANPHPSDAPILHDVTQPPPNNPLNYR